MPADVVPEESLHQAFTVPEAPSRVMDAAVTYLGGAGTVAPSLQGRMERFGDALAVHHGRIETRITAQAVPEGTRVEVHRKGQAPLQDTRAWLLLLGLGGFLLAWGVTFYNESQGGSLHPMWTMSLFLVGLVASVAVLYVADRSLERRSEGLVLALEDAVKGDPILVLHREIDALERSSALANGFLFYCGGLLASFVVYAVLFSPDVVKDIDRAVAIDTMRAVFLYPIVPALAFAGLYFVGQNRTHRDRFALVERRVQ